MWAFHQNNSSCSTHIALSHSWVGFHAGAKRIFRCYTSVGTLTKAIAIASAQMPNPKFRNYIAVAYCWLVDSFTSSVSVCLCGVYWVPGNKTRPINKINKLNFIVVGVRSSRCRFDVRHPNRASSSWRFVTYDERSRFLFIFYCVPRRPMHDALHRIIYVW